MKKATAWILAAAAAWPPAGGRCDEPGTDGAGSLTAVSAFGASTWRETPDRIGSLTGIWMKDTGFRGQWAPFRFRGGEFSQSVVLWNGIDLSDPLTGTADLGFMPDAWIDTLATWTASDPYGRGAIGAVLDIDSGIRNRARPVTDIVYDKDGGGFGRTCASFSRPLSRRFSFRIGFADRNTSDGSTEPESRNRTLHGQVRFSVSDGWRLEYLHGSGDWRAELPFTAVVPGDSTAWNPFPFDRNRLLHRLRAEGKRLNTVLDLTWDRTRYGLANAADISARNMHLSLRQSAGGRPALSWGLAAKHEILALSGPVPDPKGVWTGSAFTDAAVLLPADWRACGQVRVVRSADGKVRSAGSAGLSWHPAEETSAWLSFHQGLREPSAGERAGLMFLPFPALTTDDAMRTGWRSPHGPNASLRPERSVNWEAGLRTRIHGRVRAGLCVYSRTVSDVIGLTSSGAWDNGGGMRFRGLETEAGLGPFLGFSCSAGLNWGRFEDDSDFTLFDRPNVWASGSAVWRKALFGGDFVPMLSAGFNSWSEFWAEMPGAGFFYPVLLPAAVPLDFRISAVVMERACVSFGWRNALSASAALVPGYPLPARLTTFGFRWILFD
ncbi:MAG: TonB-dependent receptor [bacterium]|nr:TonB-dependent receptor [bacterium]